MRSIRRLALAGTLLLGLIGTASAQSDFVRGDCNVDGAVDIGDPVYILAALFSGGTPPSCDDSCDSNDDGALNIADAVYKLAFLFSGGTPPGAPNPDCGPDPTADALGCASFDQCVVAVEICDDGVDNDGDGFVDCNDFDCDLDPACQPLSHGIDIQPIWDTECTLCHGGPNPFAGLGLEFPGAYANIVDVASGECMPLDFVEPFDSSMSWLYRKVTGTHTDADIVGLGCTQPGTGDQMPPGAFCCISQGDMDLIQAWIDGGANP